MLQSRQERKWTNRTVEESIALAFLSRVWRFSCLLISCAEDL